YHGADGLRAIARRVHGLTVALADALRAAGIEVVHDAFFDTITVRVPGRAEEVHTATRARRINLREIDADTMGISLDETTTPELVAHVASCFGASLTRKISGVSDAWSPEVVRTSEFMTHAAFTSHRSEHQM